MLATGNTILPLPMFGKDGVVEEVANEMSRVATLANAHTTKFRRDFWRVKQLGAPTSEDVLGLERAVQGLRAAPKERVAIVRRKLVTCDVFVQVIAIATAD